MTQERWGDIPSDMLAGFITEVAYDIRENPTIDQHSAEQAAAAIIEAARRLRTPDTEDTRGGTET